MRFHATHKSTFHVVIASLFAMLMMAVQGNVLRAQGGPDAPATLTIRDIRVEGAETSSPSAIIAFSGIRIGDTYQPGSELIAKAIRNLYERRLFSDIKVFAEDLKENAVTIVIAVQEYPRAAETEVLGNDELDAEDVKKLMTVKAGDIVSPYELDRSSTAIEKKYSEEGYLFAKVTIIQLPSAEPNRVQLQVNVDEGPEVSIGSITFQGNSFYDDSDLKGVMDDVIEKSWWQFWRSSSFDKTKLKSDKEKVVDYYRSNGFIDAEVLKDSIWINPDNGKADVAISVYEGNRVFLRSLTVTGNEVYKTSVITKRLDVTEGEPYDQLKLEQNLNGNVEQTDLRSLYLDNGYLTFNAQKVEKRTGPDSLDVIIRVIEGDPASIRFVSIEGNTKTKDKVIRRELFTVPGDTFSKAAVIRSLRNLANLNYFNPERLTPQITPVDNTTVDVTYQVEERPSDTFNASLGISSQGLTGAIGLSFNNFSVTEPLRGGGGQVLNFNWEFGSFVQTFSLGLTEPWLFDEPTTLGANVYYQTQDLSTINTTSEYKLERFGATLTLGRRLSWPDDYFRIDGAFRFLKNNVVGQQSASSLYQNGTELSTTISFSRSSIDNPIFPKVGSRFVFSNTLAGLGDAEYTKHELKFDFYSPLAQVTESNTLVLYLNNEFGFLNDYGPLENIPPLSFFTMGGTAISGLNTIPLRGYRDRAIGPVDQVSRSLPVGKVYSKTTAELRFAISVNPIPIFALTFAEAGNVWGSMQDVDPFDLKRSIGVGMRVMLPPIGLLGFDYGYGFDTDTFDQRATGFGSASGWQFHFQFGR